MHFSIIHNTCGAIEIGRHILLANRIYWWSSGQQERCCYHLKWNKIWFLN